MLNVPAASDLCWRDNAGCALTRRKVMVDFTPLRSSHQGGRRKQFIHPKCDKETVLYLTVLSVWSLATNTLMYKRPKSPAGINALPFWHRLSFGSSARLWLFNIAYYCGEVKRLMFIPSITSEPYESCYVWNRAQHECHYALSRQVVVVCLSSRNR